MNELNPCPRCGSEIPTDAPQGLCPKCLMANALDPESTEPSYVPTVTSDPNATRPDRVNLGSLEGDIPAAPEPKGKYSILSEYGKGGMGRVLLVHDEHLGRDIALKELLPDLGDGSTPTPARHSKEMAARFLREAKITGQLEHPSITPVHEIGRKADGTLYYTMKLVRGRTLSQAIKSAKNFEERLKLLPHFVDLCNAIAYAHSRGVIHRDIKPSNVMIGDYGETVIIDWGLAKVKSARDASDPPSTPGQKTILGMRTKTKLDDDSGKTQHGQAMGTPAYMPPEQAAGDLDNIDERSDIYSLGAVLFEILTGQPPVEGKSVAEILRNVIAGKIRKVRAVEPKCQKDLAAIAEKALALNGEDRYQSGKTMADAVALWKPWPKRSRLRVAVYGIVAAVAAALTTANIISGLALEREKEEFVAAGNVLTKGDFLAMYQDTAAEESVDAVRMSTAGFLYHIQEIYEGCFESKGTLKPLYNYNKYLFSGTPIPPQDNTNLNSLLDRHLELLKELAKFARSPHVRLEKRHSFLNVPSVHHSYPEFRPGPDYGAWPDCIKLMLASAFRYQQEGDVDLALDSLTNAILIGQHFSNELEHHSILFGDQICLVPSLVFLQAHPSIISNAKTATLESFLDVLRLIKPRQHREKALALEAVTVSSLFEKSKNGTFVGSLDYGIMGMLPHSFITLRWLGNNGQSRLLAYHHKAISLSKRPYFEVVAEARRADSELFPLRRTEEFIASQLHIRWNSLDEERLELYFRNTAETETLRNIAALATLVHLHKRRSGTFPETLGEIGTQEISEFNIECLTGRPFEYTSDGSGFQIGVPREALEAHPTPSEWERLVVWGNAPQYSDDFF